MNYIIFGKTQNNARCKLDSIYADLNKDDILKYTKSPFQSSIEMKNGDYYQTSNAHENARGHKCDKIFLDESIDKTLVDNVLLPCLAFSKLSEDEQIELY